MSSSINIKSYLSNIKKYTSFDFTSYSTISNRSLSYSFGVSLLIKNEEEQVVFRKLDIKQKENNNQIQMNDIHSINDKIICSIDNNSNIIIDLFSILFIEDMVLLEIKHSQIGLSIRHTFYNKDNMKKGCLIKENYIIRIGKVEFTVLEVKSIKEEGNKANTGTCYLNISNNPYNPYVSNSHNSNNYHQQGQSSDLLLLNKDSPSKRTCRICLCDEGEGERQRGDEILSPCKCIGSYKYVHLRCIQSWFKKNTFLIKQSYLLTYTYKPFICEVCNTEISLRYTYFNENNPKKYLYLIDFYENFDSSSSFLILHNKNKTINQEKNVVYIVIFNGRTVLSVGRSSQTDVQLEDISISRVHCIIYIRNSSVYIDDNLSRYGTYLCLSTSIDEGKERTNQGETSKSYRLLSLIENKPIGIQFERYFFVITKYKSCLYKICLMENLLFQGKKKKSKERISLISDYNIILNKEFYKEITEKLERFVVNKGSSI